MPRRTESNMALPALLAQDRFAKISTDAQLAAHVQDAAKRSEFPYRELLHALIGTPLLYDEGEAGALWHEAVQRRRELARALGRPVHLRTAAMDLLYGVDAGKGKSRKPRPVVLTKRLVAELLRSAFEDPLTGAVNRARFISVVEHELKQRVRRDLLVAFVDLDGFKRLNDTRGHAAGDGVLVKFVRAARRAVRDADVIARFGGDEFTLLLLDCTVAEAPVLERRIRECFADLTRGDAVTFSIGWAVPKAGDDAASIIGRADAQMYRAKRGGAAEARSARGAAEARSARGRGGAAEARSARGGGASVVNPPQSLHERRLSVVLSDDPLEVAELQRALAEDGHPLLPARDVPTAVRLVRLARPKVLFVNRAYLRYARRILSGNAASVLIVVLGDGSVADGATDVLVVSPKNLRAAPTAVFAALGPPCSPLPRTPHALAKRIMEAVAARVGGRHLDVPSGVSGTPEMSLVSSLFGH